VALIGPCQMHALCGPVGNLFFCWFYPALNILFFLIYFLTVLIVLTYWEPVVKYSESSPYLGPIQAFLVINIANLVVSGNIWKPEIATPFLVWVLFMSITHVAGAVVVVRDLKKAFKQEVKRKQGIKQQVSLEGKKRLLLIYPIDEIMAGLTVRSYSTCQPLSMAILAGLTPKDRFHVELIDEQFEPFSYRDADLVAITGFTVYVNRAYEIAALYREKGVPVVMGGIHVSMRTEEALRFVDTVVVGEAEESWPRFLEDFLAGRMQRVYQGSYSEMKNMVLPDRSIFDDRYLGASVQTSRGCPWNCKYCSVTAFNGRRYRQRPVEEILDELETIPNRYIFFIDDNLIGYSHASEQRALELFKGMVKRKMCKRWITQTTVDIGTKPELLKWAARSGCLFFFLGLEFVDPEELKHMNKNFALKVDYSTALKNINRAGIGVIGAFIYGSDDDTREKLVKRAAFVQHNRVDVMQQSKMTAFPGTEIFYQLQKENRIIYTDYPKDWERYNFYELTHLPLNMEREAFIKTFRACVSKTYSYKTIWLKSLKTLWHTKNFEVAAASMRLNFSYRMLSLHHMQQQIDQEKREAGTAVMA